ncbi:MAG: non-homologous end-joining DNA ligase [Candidatus Bathyarchaeota archaeon]|nr:non-homologous end-joining DNA ligase [Candidatus Bathyarchaeota archaeon]
MTTRHRYKPMLAKEAKAPFTDIDWIFEVKWDGFRALAYIAHGAVSLRSRNNKELLGNFPELQELTQQSKRMILDGEIVLLNKGKVDFQTLLERGQATAPTDITLKATRSPAVYVVFDILEKDGKPLAHLPLMERKRILKESLRETKHVLLSDYVEEEGEAYYEAAIQKDLEGVVAKRKGSAYTAGLRSGDWLKIKKRRSCDCVIFGYTQGTGTRANTFGALMLGLYGKKEQAVFVGKVGTGFLQATLKTLLAEFKKIETDTAPFEADVAEKVTWLKPVLVCEVAYQVVTRDGRLRMPRFLRLRKDKQPKDCTLDQLGEAKALLEYTAKRNFAKTAEPKPETPSNNETSKIFVIQEHHARRLHYDFRLERGGVLKSWAVPKGIPASPDEKRLAVQVEDHPTEYAQFEGEIPKGEYGAGRVIIWDKGTYKTKVWSEKMVEVVLAGEKLKGRYVLVPLKKAGEKNWLMLKAKD